MKKKNIEGKYFPHTHNIRYKSLENDVFILLSLSVVFEFRTKIIKVYLTILFHPVQFFRSFAYILFSVKTLTKAVLNHVINISNITNYVLFKIR